MSFIFRAYSRLLERYPIPTKMVTCGATYVAGDFVAQVAEYKTAAVPIKDVEERRFLPNYNRLGAFAIWGVFIAGPIYHTWFAKLSLLNPESLRARNIRRSLLRLISPIYKSRPSNMYGTQLLEVPVRIKEVDVMKVTLPPVKPSPAWVLKGVKVALDQIVFSPVYNLLFFMGIPLLRASLPNAPLPMSKENFPKLFSEAKDHMKEVYWKAYALDCTIWPFLQFFGTFSLPERFQAPFVNLCNVGWNGILSYFASAH